MPPAIAPPSAPVTGRSKTPLFAGVGVLVAAIATGAALLLLDGDDEDPSLTADALETPMEPAAEGQHHDHDAPGEATDPVEEPTIATSYWSLDAGEERRVGDALVLFAMGARMLALTIPRFGVVVDKPSDVALLPTLLRRAAQREVLDYRIVPGLSEAPQDRLSDVSRAAGRVTYLRLGALYEPFGWWSVDPRCRRHSLRRRRDRGDLQLRQRGDLRRRAQLVASRGDEVGG